MQNKNAWEDFTIYFSSRKAKDKKRKNRVRKSERDKQRNQKKKTSNRIEKEEKKNIQTKNEEKIKSHEGNNNKWRLLLNCSCIVLCENNLISVNNSNYIYTVRNTHLYGGVFK